VCGDPGELFEGDRRLEGIVASRPIQPAIDAYGRYARASNLADHVELLALQGERLTVNELADVIRDQGWTAKMHELFTPGPEPPSRSTKDLVEGMTPFGRRGHAAGASAWQVPRLASDVKDG